MYARLSALTVALFIALVAAGGASAAAPALGSERVLRDAIAPGVVRGIDGFGTATVLVPANGYVTYLVQADPALAGRRLEIWANNGEGWRYVTARQVAGDGTVHYFARVSAAIGLWAKLPGDATTPDAVSHGRRAATSDEATTLIRVWCDDFAPGRPDAGGLVQRAVGARPGSLVTVVLCSNGSTGFSWAAAAIDSAHLRLVSHAYHAGPMAIGAAGAETWTFRVLAGGVGHAVLTYDRPWEGGEKATWLFVLTTRS
jgi:predicted secreted protein